MEQVKIGWVYHREQLIRLAHGGIETLWIVTPQLTTEQLVTLEALISSAKSTIVIVDGDDSGLNAEALTSPLCDSIRVYRYMAGFSMGATCIAGVRADQTIWAATGSVSQGIPPGRPSVELFSTIEGPAGDSSLAELLDWLAELRHFSSEVIPAQLISEGVPPAQPHPTAYPAASAASIAPINVRPGIVQTHYAWDLFLTYIRETQLFASYKLVIIALLLKSGAGVMQLDECARRFHSFYLGLEELHLTPERSTGNPPPLMLHPSAHSSTAVQQLLLKEPKRAFKNTGDVVVFRKGVTDTRIYIARSVWAACTAADLDFAFDAVLTRLEDYFQRYTADSRFVREVLANTVQSL